MASLHCTLSGGAGTKYRPWWPHFWATAGTKVPGAKESRNIAQEIEVTLAP